MHENAVRPETGTVLAQMPSLVERAAFLHGRGNFFFHRAAFSVLRRENQRRDFTDGFTLRPTEKAFRATAPEGDSIFRIDQKHRVLTRAFDEQTETLFALAKRFSRLLARGNVVKTIDRADDFAPLIL